MKIILGICLLIHTPLLLAQDSAFICKDKIEQRMEDIKDPFLNMGKCTLERIQENIYYSCRLGLPIESRWMWLDKVSAVCIGQDKVLHFNTQLNTWFETNKNTSYIPEKFHFVYRRIREIIII